MTYSKLFFDLDDTLYPHTSGLWEAIRKRMNKFLLERLNLSPDEASELSRVYFQTYGTTLRGLQIHYSIDTDEYLSYVHDLPLEDYISNDPQLREMLIGLPQEKWIFTNADAQHAKRVLKIMGIEDCFVGIVDVRAMEFLCKPDHQAYQLAMTITGVSNPENCVLIDDAIRNLEPAHEIGFKTVLVGSQESHPAVDLSIENILELPQVFPQLWTKGKPN